MNRRKFLQYVSLTSAVAIGTGAIAPRYLQGIAQAATSSSKRLIVIFLRGAVDGLNVLVPYRDPLYYAARPTIAIPKPGQVGGALDLNDYFGLHPALEPLMPLWEQGSLAFISACGSPDPSRSHFDAQDYIETGTPGLKATEDGWMNRLLAALPNPSPVSALSLGTTIPLILQGQNSVTNLQLSQGATTPLAIDRPEIATAFDRLYAGTTPLSRFYQEGRSARQTLLRHLETDSPEAADKGAPTPALFPLEARRLARLMMKEPKIQLAFMALGGWDTHIEQGGSTGTLAERLQYLGEGLAALVQELGGAYGETAIAVVSEFGRTVKENGNGGTDHGHGNALWLLGGGIRGGKIYGKWSGLESDRLYEGRDVAVTTDFRDPIATILQRHLQLNPAQINAIFPGYQRQQGDFGF